jgi:hypothetical protein
VFRDPGRAYKHWEDGVNRLGKCFISTKDWGDNKHCQELQHGVWDPIKECHARGGWDASITCATLDTALVVAGTKGVGAVRATVRAARPNIGGARFAQTSYSETFSKGGIFEGQTIDDVAGALRSGSMSAKDVPINVIVRDGNTLILNTRSAQALTRAGVPRKSWNVINRTGDEFFEGLLSGQLDRNRLDSSGTDLP